MCFPAPLGMHSCSVRKTMSGGGHEAVHPSLSGAMRLEPPFSHVHRLSPVPVPVKASEVGVCLPPGDPHSHRPTLDGRFGLCVTRAAELWLQ